MKKKIFLVALSALALTACTNDEMIEEKQNEIKFAVTTEATTRAGAVATTTNTIDNFKVWAYTSYIAGTSGSWSQDKDIYIKGNKVTKNSNGNWEFEGGSYFWPNSSLNFYAFSPTTYLDNTTLVEEYDAYQITCQTDGNNDLLYATNRYNTLHINRDVVPLNFHHAFAQLIFTATNTNQHLGVEISKIEVAQMYTKGKLNIQTYYSTTPNLDEDNNSTDIDNSYSEWGTWENQNTIGTLAATLQIPENATGINVATRDGGNEHKNRIVWLTANTLTSNDPNHGDDAHTDNKGLYVLPQTLKYWNPSEAWDATSTDNKAYFIIYCKVWNKPELTTAADENAIYLWGDKDTYAAVAVPVVVPTTTTDADGNTSTTNTFTWKQGTKYRYNFDFKKGVGYVPPTDEDNPGEPVLVPIQVSITVDEFQSANPQPGIDMEATEE